MKGIVFPKLTQLTNHFTPVLNAHFFMPYLTHIWHCNYMSRKTIELCAIVPVDFPRSFKSGSVAVFFRAASESTHPAQQCPPLLMVSFRHLEHSLHLQVQFRLCLIGASCEVIYYQQNVVKSSLTFLQMGKVYGHHLKMAVVVMLSISVLGGIRSFFCWMQGHLLAIKYAISFCM